jgi:hypothetical protein
VVVEGVEIEDISVEEVVCGGVVVTGGFVERVLKLSLDLLTPGLMLSLD